MKLFSDNKNLLKVDTLKIDFFQLIWMESFKTTSIIFLAMDVNKSFSAKGNLLNSSCVLQLYHFIMLVVVLFTKFRVFL